MTQQLRVSVLTAPLAAIDRRALSQAWYSALHLSKARHEQAAPAATPASKAAGSRLSPPERNAAQSPARPFAPSPRVAQRATTARGVPPPERRAERSSLAVKIERSFLSVRRREQRATFTIDGTRSRVHVSLRTSGSRVTLVAVCAPTVRSAVAKALQDARYALARRGIDLSLETREAACS
ncbi:MAG: hypothetical protein ABI282_00955 [Candidatus Baltobacteraceae bacterium]